MKNRKLLRIPACLAIAFSLARCVGTAGFETGDTTTPDPGGSVTPLEIRGDYTDNYNATYTITQTSWTNYGCTKTIISYDNSARSFVYQETNDVINCFNPNKFGKIYWTQLQVNGNFYYCENVYGKNTAVEATNDPSPPSSSDLLTGCVTFPWTHMTKN